METSIYHIACFQANPRYFIDSLACIKTETYVNIDVNMSFALWTSMGHQGILVACSHAPNA